MIQSSGAQKKNNKNAEKALNILSSLSEVLYVETYRRGNFGLDATDEEKKAFIKNHKQAAEKYEFDMSQPRRNARRKNNDEL